MIIATRDQVINLLW